jgi:hypothetical protein
VGGFPLPPMRELIIKMIITILILLILIMGGKIDVSLNCGRFYGPIVRPQMNECDNHHKGHRV